MEDSVKQKRFNVSHDGPRPWFIRPSSNMLTLMKRLEGAIIDIVGAAGR